MISPVEDVVPPGFFLHGEYMTRAEQKKEKLKKEQEFIDNYDAIIKECFNVDDENYLHMKSILDNSVSRGLSKEFGYELHHFIPRSYFKKKKTFVVDNNNLYKLTYAEHFLVHYYGYLCATKFMKNCMCFALVNMKRVCCMNVGKQDIEKLSFIFENVKKDIAVTRQKYYKSKTFKYYDAKIKEQYGEKYKLINVYYVHEPSNDRCECDFYCTRCGRKHHIRSVQFLIAKNFRCDCEKGFKENVNVLYFGINKKTHVAEWDIQHISYTPSMQRSGAFITKEFIKQHPLKLDNWWIKNSIIDIKPEEYCWKLPLDKKLKRTNEWGHIEPNEYMKLLIEEV